MLFDPYFENSNPRKKPMNFKRTIASAGGAVSLLGMWLLPSIAMAADAPKLDSGNTA